MPERLRRMVFLMPMVQVLVFGYAVSTDVRNVPTAVMDFDRSVSSRELLSGFSASGTFRFVAETRDTAAAQELLDRGTGGGSPRVDHGLAGGLGAGGAARVHGRA